MTEEHQLFFDLGLPPREAMGQDAEYARHKQDVTSAPSPSWRIPSGVRRAVSLWSSSAPPISPTSSIWAFRASSGR